MERHTQLSWLIPHLIGFRLRLGSIPSNVCFRIENGARWWLKYEWLFDFPSSFFLFYGLCGTTQYFSILWPTYFSFKNLYVKPRGWWFGIIKLPCTFLRLAKELGFGSVPHIFASFGHFCSQQTLQICLIYPFYLGWNSHDWTKWDYELQVF